MDGPKETIYYLLPPAMLLMFSATFLLALVVEEPYPAVYQPAFKQAAVYPDLIVTHATLATVHYDGGQSRTVKMEHLFPYLPNDRGPKLFKLLKRQLLPF